MERLKSCSRVDLSVSSFAYVEEIKSLDGHKMQKKPNMI